MTESKTTEPRVNFATVRDCEDELHVECRFWDGQKFAAVTVDRNFPQLAQDIATYLSRKDYGQ